MTEDRDKMLLLLKNKIVSGDFNYDYGDDWYTEDMTIYEIDDNPVLEDITVTFKYSGGSRDWRGDDHWDYWGSEGEIALGDLLDFLLNRKFGNSNMEKQYKDKLNYILEDSYTIDDGMTITDEYGEDPWEEI